VASEELETVRLVLVNESVGYECIAVEMRAQAEVVLQETNVELPIVSDELWERRRSIVERREDGPTEHRGNILAQVVADKSGARGRVRHLFLVERLRRFTM
jgi:hypothetical protein